LGVTVKWAVIQDFDFAEYFPPLQRIRWELKRAILDKLGIEAAIRGEIDVFEEDTVLGGADGGAGLGEVDGEVVEILRFAQDDMAGPAQDDRVGSAEEGGIEAKENKY